MKLCTLAVFVFMACSATVKAATYYVDGQGGDDDNSGQSVTAAWRTIGKANAQLQPGDTVYIREGTYDETIRPSTSGTDGNYISYFRYNDEEAVITGVADGVDLRNRHYIVIDGLTILDVSGYWVNMRGEDSAHSSTHNVIRNCHMENSSRDAAWAGIYMDVGIEYNRVIGNTLIGLYDPDDLIYINGDARYNLFEENTFLYGSHQGVDLLGRTGNTYRNVLRNNRFWNPYHTALCVNENADWTLIEGNVFLDSGENCEDNLYGDEQTRTRPKRDHKSIQLASSNCIIRNNVLVNNGCMSMNTYPEKPAYALYNHVYHNVFYKESRAISMNCPDPVYGNVIKNNILQDSAEYESYQYITTAPDDNYYVRNGILGSSVYRYPDGTQSVSFLETQYQDQWHDNLHADAVFTDPGAVNDDDNRNLDPQWFELKSTSPMIDAGAFLTAAATGGNGTSITVEDASYFYDGWGIPGEQGDLIQFEGQAETARITSIDYDHNVITIDRTLSWYAQQGISLAYHGSAPDIGAFEYASGTTTTYTLSTSATDGSVSPGEGTYNAGTSVTLTATPNSGYRFTGWSGDLSGNTNPDTLTMNGDKSVTANFEPDDAATYTLSTNATHGSVSPSEGTYALGTSVTLTASAASGYRFTGWSGDLSGNTNPDTLTMNGDKSVTANFELDNTDETPPVAVATSPEAGAVQVPLNSLVTLRVSDEGEGVDANTVTISVNGTTVYTGNVSSDESAIGICRRTGTEAAYTYTYQSNLDFDFSEAVTVRVNATDRNGNVMSEYVYLFETEMWAFGANRPVSSELAGTDQSRPVTASDSSGHLWVLWEAGAIGQRDIYVGRRVPGESSFASPVQLTTDVADQSHPDLAIDPNDTLYAVWQDNRSGHWDIYFSTSTDGVNWSDATPVTDSDDNQTSPVIVVDQASGCHVAWTDDAGGQQDIYVSSSSDAFATATTSQVTFDLSDQTEPDIAVDALGNVTVVWTDTRQGAGDIYGAVSDGGSWTNVALVTDAGNQYTPAVASEAEGLWLHLVWADDSAGDSDVYFASTEGLPSSPLSGVGLVDDTLGADQLAPTIATVDSTGDGLKVFVCWQDWRNVTTAGEDTDLYFVEVRGGSETNVLVGDDGTGSNQSEPALGVNSSGYPYVVWTDDREGPTGIYHAGTMSWGSEVLDSQTVTASEGGTVGTTSPSSVGDVSVVIPPAASSQDATVTIQELENPPAVPASGVLSYDFGPSGLEFDEPATITIPYEVAEFGDEPPTPLWYDSQTGSLSQEGITDIESIDLSPIVKAVRFKTTHFTPYHLVSSVAVEDMTAGSSSSGGCSLSYGGDASDPLGYFIPYVLVAGMMAVFRFRDRRRRT